MLEPTAGGKASAYARGDRCVASFACAACAALLLLGCSDAQDSLDGFATPETPVGEMAGSAESAGAAGQPQASHSSVARAADAERAERLARGEILSFACRPCHGLAPGDESPVGPHLYGMFGRPAARVEGFEYSPALRQSGIVWTAESLDAWLAQPESFLPGNDMDFAGFRSAADRRALIEYLRIRTGTSGGAAEATQAVENPSN